MVNYGYECRSWKLHDKVKLIETLSKRLGFVIGWENKTVVDEPYLELDGLYAGVRIRKITHLSDKETKELAKKADEIYKEVENKMSKL